MDNVGFYAAVCLALACLLYLWIGLERGATFSFLRVHRRSERPVAYWLDIAFHTLVAVLLITSIFTYAFG